MDEVKVATHIGPKLNDLAKAITMLGTGLDALEERINPALGQPREPGVRPNRDDVAGTSPVFNELCSLEELVLTMNAKVRSLIERVEL